MRNLLARLVIVLAISAPAFACEGDANHPASGDAAAKTRGVKKDKKAATTPTTSQAGAAPTTQK